VAIKSFFEGRYYIYKGPPELVSDSKKNVIVLNGMRHYARAAGGSQVVWDKEDYVSQYTPAAMAHFEQLEIDDGMAFDHYVTGRAAIKGRPVCG